MIHKNRGNRRWMDKRKRKRKYNLAKTIYDKIKGVIGKYDKGNIHDLNHNKEESNYDDFYHDGISHSDKKKVGSCNDKVKDYTNGFDEIDAMVRADIESYADWWMEGYSDDEWYMQKRYCNCEPYTNYIAKIVKDGKNNETD